MKFNENEKKNLKIHLNFVNENLDKFTLLLRTLLCLIIVGGGQIVNFWEKNPQVHLIIIRE